MSLIETAKMAKNHWIVSAVAVSVLLATACGSNGQDGEPAWTTDDFIPVEEGAPTVSSGSDTEPQSYPENGELEERSNSFSWFRWSKGDPDRILKPYSTHICGLTMVRGQLASGSDLRVKRSGSNWVLSGRQSASNFLQADAVCEPLSAFQVDQGRSVSIVSPRDSLDWGISTSSQNVTRTVNMPAGTAPIFRGLAGHFEGRGERARVTLDPTVEIKVGGQGGLHMAFASALSFGLSSSETPRYETSCMDGFIAKESVTVNTDIKALGCRNSSCCPHAGFAQLSSTFCYLSSVSGDFNGADEWVQVFPNRDSGKWQMTANAASGNGITATATCLAMDQRDDSPISTVR